MQKEQTNNSFNKLYNTYSDDILRYCYSILKNYEEAKDIVHEVFIRHFEKEKSFKEQCSYKTWLFVIARNLCFSRLRNKSFYSDSLDNHSLSKNYTENFDSIISIKDALMKISNEDNELLYLKEYERYSYAEISEITNLSIENIAIKLFRVKKQLRKYLKDLKP